MIPLFPEFKNISIQDKHEVEKITKQFEPYSDYNFVSLWSWDTDEEIEISILNDNLVVKFSDYLDQSIFYSLLGTNKLDETVSALIEHSIKVGLKPILKLVPEVVIKNLHHPEKYVIEEDRDGFDYILAVEDQVGLEGKKFHPKKNFIKRYLKEYEKSTRVEPLMLSEQKTKEDVLNLFYAWERSRGKERSETENELKAIKRLLDNSQLLDVLAVGVFINNELKGFAIDEIVSDKYGVAHFEKVDLDYVGIFQYLKHQSAILFHKHSVKYMNIEQDMGILGLRKAKEMMHPDHFLKKYTITAKN